MLSLRLTLGPRDGHNGDVDEEESVDFQYMHPLQIAILIVGTRGDVQPFVAVSKHLQVIVVHVKLYTFTSW